MWLPCKMSLLWNFFFRITYFDLYGNPQAQQPSRESVPFISSVPLSCFLFQEPDSLPGAGTGGPGGRRGRETDPGTGGETPGIEICAFPPSFWQSLLQFYVDPHWFSMQIRIQVFIQCCRSGMFIPDPNFSFPDPNFFHPGSVFFPSPGSASKNLSILTQKLFLCSRKYDPGCSSRIRILIFYPSRIPDPGVKKALDLGSVILMRIRIQRANQCGFRFCLDF